MKQGQLLARLDRTQLDAQLAQNDAARARADAAIDQAQKPDRAVGGQLDFASNDYDRAQKTRRTGHGRLDHRAARDQHENGAGPARRRQGRARGAAGRPQPPRRRAAGIDGAHRPHGGACPRRGHHQPALGQARRRPPSIAGEPLFRIIADGDIDLDADVPEQWLPRLRSACRRRSSCPASRRRSAARSGSSTRKSTRRAAPARSRIALADVSHARIGAFASGEVELASRDGVGAPATAVEREGDEGVCYVVARRRGRRAARSSRHRRRRRGRDQVRRRARRKHGGARRLVPAARRPGATDARSSRRGG